MPYQKLLSNLLLSVIVSGCATAPESKSPEVNAGQPLAIPNLPIEVSVISDVNGPLHEYPVNSDGVRYQAYLEATKNDRYRILVNNSSDHTVALVIAVDGRNIISGQKSNLKNTERVYILDSDASAEFRGWRVGANQVNRFSFPDPANTSAAAWSDVPALGEIAVAAYPEKQSGESGQATGDALRAESAPTNETDEANTETKAMYGDTVTFPSTLVRFESKPEPIEKVYFKYDSRDNLCKQGIIAGC